MSLAILKKKYNAQQGLSGKSKNGFSLKGNKRNIKGIGQTRENSSVRTIFRGTEPTGHGALQPSSRRSCGTTKCNDFPISVINSQTPASCECVQTSALTTKGLILAKIYNPTQSSNSYLGLAGCPENSKCRPWIVKDMSPEGRSYTIYINKLKVKVASETAIICKERFNTSTINLSICKDKESSESQQSTCNNTYMLGSRKVSRNNVVDHSSKGAMSSGEYTNTKLLMINCLPTPPCKASFPLVLNKKNCQAVYDTPEEAIKDGLLPEDWMNCNYKYPINSVYTINPFV